MPPLRHSQSSVSNKPNTNVVRSATAVTTSAMTSSTAPLCMLPGEFLVHLKRQSTGFGFNLVGGAEENTQVSIGALLMGGSAQLSEVVRTGDKLISIDGVRVIGATHAEVVELLDRAAHTVGQVTLGLQRGKIEIDNLNSHYSLEPVDVVISRSEKSDGFGFFLTNTKPNHNSLNEHSNAQLVPGSQAERMGLLSVGDQILAVNGIPTCGLHHDEVVRLIRESGNHIALKILPYSGSASRGRKHPLPMRDSVEFPVTLFRGSRGFGFSIRGGQEFNRMPLVVLRIADGGAAQMDGHLKINDLIDLVLINMTLHQIGFTEL
ncbi:membrane associated guanylate kinase inverted related [Schistosoma mansoni]|uniref:membrane associated guanylate kinase inverted related n=1 Tax=Schistosoma mansoni TaxID=6183 RepID=UPI00022DC775|nr:membrane associated guanylate kinase inverted related [Schistosoma mansoni]|eukprot:XP_018651516.1 membrane associated guanylate kinase inverted related [Schistosoma mansoni]